MPGVLAGLHGVFSLVFLLLSTPARATICPSPFLPIATDQAPFAVPQKYPNVVSLGWFTMGRRSPTIYGLTKYGVFGAYLGSNPGAPSPSVFQISFREGGPVGLGSFGDCWPGPSVISVADSPNGAGRMPMGWFDGTGCGKPEQLVSMNPPGGSESYGQQIDVANGNAVAATVAGAALTTGGKYVAYFVDSSTLYVVDVTNPAFNYGANPLHAFSTFPAWAGASRLTVLGDASADRYAASVFFTKGAGTIKFASIGSDGTLAPLAATVATSSGAASSPANQQLTTYRTSTGWLVFLVVSGGIDVFSFDGTSASRLGTIANGANKYNYLVAPYGSPTPVLLAQKSSMDVDVIAGGYLAGQSGSPTVAASIAAIANDTTEGFGAYVDPSDPGNLYLYRAILASPFIMQTDTFDASCITSPPTPNPVASFVLTNKSAQSRTDTNSYVGDAFSFTDTSKPGTGGAITNWYVWANYNSSTSTKGNADVAATSSPAYASIILPCQALVSNQCSYSPGSITGASVSEKFGELVSASSLDSPAATSSVTLKVPQTRVAAQGSDGSVKILTGGSIDASSSDGSPTGFAWTFNGSSSSCAGATCAPPGGTTTFSVAAKYAGGYQAAVVSGSVVFTDIAGSISVPATLFSGQGTTSATFALQKGSSVSITGVTYAYDNGSPTTITPAPPLSGNVTINVPASLTTGVSHTVKFTVTFSGGSLGSSVVFSDTFLFSAVQYSPKVWISKTPSMTATDTCSTNVFQGVTTTCSGSAGTFYLSDTGDGGKPSFPVTWNFGDGSPNDTSHTSTDFVSHAFASGGPYTVTLTVQGTAVTQKFTVGTSTPLTASISGATSVKAGTSSTWSASVSGGQPIYTYNWSSSDGGSGSGTSFTHTFNAAGTISLTVHDSAGGNKTATKSVSIQTGGGGCPPNCGSPNQIVIAGAPSIAVNTPGTWTASANGVDPSTIFVDWKVNGASVPSSGSYTLSHQFAAAGTYTLTASGSKIISGSIIPLTAGSKTITVTGVPDDCSTTQTCAPTSTFSVSGATFNQFGSTYSAKAGDVVGFSGLDTGAATQFAWDFGDQTAGTGKTITHAYASSGNFNVTLTATNPNGGKHTSTNSRFTITGQGFSALIVPGAGDFAVSGSGGGLSTELSLFNNSNAAVNVALDFEAVDASSIDPTKISFPTSGPGFVTLQPNQGWTTENVSSLLCDNGTCGIGTLFMKYTGSQPSALARIYFSSGEGTPTYGTYLPAYAVTAAGVSTLSSGSAANGVQNIVGLRFDDDFQGGITIVSASPTGGAYDVKLFRDDGTQMGTTLQEQIPGYQQVKIHKEDFGIVASDPEHIYYATVTPSAGSSAPSIAIGTVKDNRTQDQLLLTDDTPRLSVPGGGPAYYYLAGVGRTSSGAKTDVYMLNTSTYPIPFNFRFHYIDGSGEHTAQISELLPIGGGQALAVPDVITSLFPGITGDVLGDMRIDYQVPADQGAVIIEGRNYTDLGSGTYGMQIPAYAGSDGLLPGSSGRIVLTGLHNDLTAGSTTDYDFISRFGFVALGDGQVTVHADAYDQTDGTLFWSGDFTLNNGGYGHFLYIPTTGQFAPAPFAAHPAFNMVVKVTAGDGTTPASAFATVQDTRSRDLVFIPGKRPSS